MARRSRRGNMLALIGAFCILMVIILLFALGYVRLLGTSSEQKTAIEAAALAAAREISKIVINTPEFGFIGLSDSAPNGSGTTAGDTFRTPVHSINTLIGTARLDYIIADALGSDGDEFKELALRDLAAAKTRADELIDRIDAAVLPGGVAQDKNGADVTPYTAAEDAYTQNVIRIAGKCDYVTGSMQITIGALANGAATNIPVPKPLSSDPSLDTSNTIVARTYDHFSGNWINETYYKSYTSYPFDGQDFVFAAIGDSVRLVDPALWRATLTGLPYYYRTVVRAEALETVQDPDRTHTLKAVACAQPSNVWDPKPVPGALQISFPDGMPTGPEDITRPRDLYGAASNNMAASGVGVDMYTANGGDFPVTTGSSIAADNGSWPVPSDTTQTAATACKIAVYDWLKRAGTKANVTSVIGMHATPFKEVTQAPLSLSALVPIGAPIAGSVPRGICHMYFFDSDGVVSYDVKEQKPQPYYVVAENQTYMECFRAIDDGHVLAEQIELSGLALGPPVNAVDDGVVVLGPAYDMYIRLYSRRPGTMNGGRHAGEPMDNIWLVTQKPASVKLSGNRGAATVDSIVMSGRGAHGNMNGWKNKNKGKDSGGISTGTQGVPPAIIGRQDFPQSAPATIDPNPALYEKYDDTGGGPRLTYKSYSSGGTGDGTTSDIRFRRVLDIYKESAPSQVESGYIGLK
ncbi:hypothetical protein KF707_20295 [Candidatus Obscuribacterales bacterium]|nr:hypothetical protein [Candidatus Obscuribacterales bacterium]